MTDAQKGRLSVLIVGYALTTVGAWCLWGGAAALFAAGIVTLASVYIVDTGRD